MNEHEQHLIRDYLDDRITPKGLERLERLLESDGSARAEFRAMATLEEGLRDLAIENTMVSHGHDMTHNLAAPSGHFGRWSHVKQFGIATLSVVCVIVTILLARQADRGDEWGTAIARIESLSKDVSFLPDQEFAVSEGISLGKGWLRLERGRARVLFRSGATVDLEGPAVFGIDTPMRAYLDYGKVSVHAPETARDFIVATESMEVVDLGTRFEIHVDAKSHESKVSVIEGLVDLHLGSRGANRIIQSLEAGCAALVDETGRIIEIRNNAAVDPARTGANAQLLAHWTFDTVGGLGVVEDSSARQLDAILRMPDQTRLIAGVSGKAFSIDGRDVAVDLCEHASVLAQMSSFTLSAWVRNPDESLAIVFSLSGETEQHRVQFYLTRGFVRFGWQDGLYFDSISGGVDGWNADQWYHVAVTAGDGVVRLYRDGELLGSGAVGSNIGAPISTPSMVKDASRAYLGRLHDGRQGAGTVHQWFTGQIDDVQIYSGALNNEAIRFLHANSGEVWSAGALHE